MSPTTNYQTASGKMALMSLPHSNRLAQLLDTEFVALIFNFDNVVAFPGKPGHAILGRHLQLLRKGLILCPCTTREEFLRAEYIDPIFGMAKKAGLAAEHLPLFCGSRNGAITEHAFTGRILGHHPIVDEISNAFLKHRLVTALATLSPPNTAGLWKARYDLFSKMHGIEPDSRSEQHPTTYFDPHGNGKQYKLTLSWDLGYINQAMYQGDPAIGMAIDLIKELNRGELPLDLAAMASLTEKILRDDGILLSVGAATTPHPGLDVYAAGVNTSCTYKAIRHLLVSMHKMGEAELDACILTLGDSLCHSDDSLLKCGVAVTSQDDWRSGAPFVLSFPRIRSPNRRARMLFSYLKVKNSPYGL